MQGIASMPRSNAKVIGGPLIIVVVLLFLGQQVHWFQKAIMFMHIYIQNIWSNLT